MAEEIFELLVTPEVTKSSEVDPRRHSTGRQTPRNSGEKVLPSYLRASTGSCHDFCKYGRKHVIDEKERQSVPLRVPRKPLGQSSKEGVWGTKKTSEVNVKASLDLEPQFPAASGASKPIFLPKSIDSQKLENEVLVNGNTGSEESFGGTNKTSVTNPRESLDSKPCISCNSGFNKQGMSLPKKSADSQKQVVKEVRISGKKTSSARSLDTIKMSLAKLTASRDSSPRISDNSDSSKQKTLAKSLDSSKLVKNEVLVNRRKTPPFEVKPSSHPRSQASDVTNTLRRKVASTSKKAEASTKVIPLEAIKIGLFAKHVTSSKPKAVPVRMASSKNLSEGSDCQSKNKLKLGRLAASTNVAAKKLQTPSKDSLPPRPSLKRVASINSKRHKGLKILSCLKDQSSARKVGPKPQRNQEVEEKTLYVIETEDENKTLQSDQNGSHNIESSLPQSPSSLKLLSTSISQSSSPEDQEESEYATSEVEEDSSSVNSETELVENGRNSDEDGKGKLREDGIICSEDKDIQMAKVKFRRGKVVETQSEKNSPRRLKFRRAKVFGDNPNFKAEAQRKSFKRREGTNAESTGATPGPEAVVLRHQDVQDKKDALGLFNNVIEETASKLAETRKSKVKALVGAFETVISLQERKSSADTVC